MEKIDRRGPDECWLWTASIGTWGYGTFWINGKNVNASAAAYRLLVGPVPDGMVVCHTCDNPACCNPQHLWLGTQGDNVRDCNNKGRARGVFTKGHKPYGDHILGDRLAKLAAKLYHEHGVSQTDIGLLSGFASSTISRAIREFRPNDNHE